VVPWAGVKCPRLRTVVPARRWNVAVYKITEYLETFRVGIFYVLVGILCVIAPCFEIKLCVIAPCFEIKLCNYNYNRDCS
jgi:hypothetical protein